MKVDGFNWDLKNSFKNELKHTNMNKRLPKLKSDRAAKTFLKKDLSDYISKENFKPISFEFAPKDKSITLRVSNQLLEEVQMAAKRRGINYQKFIREAIEQFLKKVV
jgi:predicted DNA binding CopG/RHH family protein